MPQQMKTGIQGLDRVLEGGSLYHNSILIKGAPGSGKTTLGIQIIYNGVASYNEPGIVVLFEQFPQQLHRDLTAYEWDIERLEKEGKMTLIFARAEEALGKDQISDSLLVSQIHDAVVQTGARRILIDSISHLLNIIQPKMEHRELVLRFINALKSIGLTPIFTAEQERESGAIGYEEYLTDCVLHLSNQASTDKTFPMRLLEVQKTRGHGHIRGRHPYRIGSKGIEVFPHVLPQSLEIDMNKEKIIKKISTGITGLDEMLGGGYVKGTSTIIAGMPGTYKTTLCAQFLESGARQGDNGLFLTFNESPDFLVNVLEERGIPIRKHVANGTIRIRHFFPKTFYMDELLLLLDEELQSNSIQRIIIDGINDVERSIEDPATYKDFMASLLAILIRNNATALMTQKLDKFTSNAPLTDIRYASTVDGIIYLGTIELESAVRKVISVLKMRGGDYSGDLREITCGANGLNVSDKFVGLSGILAGNPQGQYKKTVEEIFQPLYFVNDFLDVATTPGMEEQQKNEILKSMKSEVGKLIERLKQYFDIEEKR